MKGTELFQKTINDYLSDEAQTNVLLGEALQNPSKNIDDCINYIFKTVKSSGFNGFQDEEVYEMATEYYLSEIDTQLEKLQCQVIINRIPVLTDQEKDDAKQKAFDQLILENKSKISSQKSKSASKTNDSFLTLF